MKTNPPADNAHAKDYRKILSKMFENNLKEFAPAGMEKQKVLISYSYGDKRAVTCPGIGNTIKTAYESARNTVLKKIKDKSSVPVWTCMDFVTNEEKVDRNEFYERVSNTRTNYYRYGIALDDFYQISFLEQELNGAGLIDYKQSPVVLNANNVTKHLRYKGVFGSKQEFSPDNTDKVIVFGSKSCFYDAENGEYYNLHSDGLEKGIRKAEADREFLIDQIKKTTGYLNGTANDDGSFVYGYFPCYGGAVPGYNAIRHILSVISLIDCYEYTPSSELKENIKKCYDYIMREAYKAIDENSSVIVDHANGDEIRLGALGLAILMIVKYSDFTGDTGQLDAAKKLANFILRMQDEADGSFNHVLRYPDLSLKEKFKIVYYSGEACYGLMAIYGRDPDERYLNASKRAFDFFIKNDYHKYFDHWLAYAANEVTKYAPDDKIFEFGIKNALSMIDFIIERETTFATFLEMLNASGGLFERIEESGKGYLFEGYEKEKFYQALKIRVKRQLNGVMFPEMAMFFKNPRQILYGVYIRHHTFRIRDDDVAHHLIGYRNYLKNRQPQ